MPGTSFVQFDPAPSTSSREILGPSTRRRAIKFFAPSVGRVTLSNAPVTVDGAGWVLAAGQNPIEFDYDNDGAIVTQPWHALYTASATGVGYSQVMD